MMQQMMQVVTRDQISWQAVEDLEQYLESDLKSPTGFGLPLIRFAHHLASVVLTVNHALYDDWSLVALLDDVSLVYRGLDPKPHVQFSTAIHHIQVMDRGAGIEFYSERLDKALHTLLRQL
jgi:hypothetical protein